jgi:hypothetical protein
VSLWKNFVARVRLGRRSPLLKYVLFFVAIQIFFEQRNTSNVLSRLAVLASLSQRSSFEIHPYKEEWTTDWAQTPNGKVYSNKAPGPIFLSFPLYWLWDRWGVDSSLPEESNIAKRNHQGFHFLKWISVLLQILPFAILALYFLGHWSELSLSFQTQQLWLLAFLFGNTASIFMNTFFGHGLATVFILMSVIAVVEKSWGWVGFFFGWALLSDYGVTFQIPALLAALALWGGVQIWPKLAIGALLPASLWIFYHTLCFGSPWSLPNKYQNPIYKDVAESATSLWGVFDFMPNWKVFLKLWIGPERGLLFSQPWIFFAFGWTLYWVLSKKKSRVDSPFLAKPLIVYYLGSFLGLLWMNSSFGGWHGGASAGPRYLSMSLPLMSFLLIPCLENANALMKRLAKSSILYSFMLFGLILSTSITSGENKTLLGALIDSLWNANSKTALLRFLLFVSLSAFLYFRLKSSSKTLFSHS